MQHLGPWISSPSLGSVLLTISQLLFFFLFSLVLGLNTLSPWGLGFLHGICMTGWVNSAHTPLTQSGLDEFFFCELCFLPHPCSTSPLCPCVCILCAVVCLSLCWFYCVFTCSGPPHPTSYPPLPSLSFLSLCAATFWLRCFRRHPQTYSGIFTQSGHDPKWPTAPQTGVHRFGLVTGQPCRQ